MVKGRKAARPVHLRAARVFATSVVVLFALVLAPQALANTFTVSNSNPTGPGSFDQAIQDANLNPGADIIDFDDSGGADGIAPPGDAVTDTVTIEDTGDFTLAGVDFEQGAFASSLENVTVAGGSTGVTVGSGASVTIDNSQIEGNVTGVDVIGTGTASVQNSQITNNTADGLLFQNDGNDVVSGDTITGNSAGVHATGPGADVSIRNNSIADNSSFGILLDQGANEGLQPPEVTSATTSNNTFDAGGTITGEPNTQYDVQFFEDSSCDPAGAGESLLGDSSVTTDGSGSASFTFETSGAPAAVTATLSDGIATSEFSSCATVSAGGGGSGPGPSTFVVNTNADDDDGGCGVAADCTLRDAIESANAAGGGTIAFDPSPGSYLIQPTSPLPAIMAPVTIDGSGVPVRIDGTDASGGSGGLDFEGGSSIVTNLTFSNWQTAGVYVDLGADVTVLDSFFGTDSFGTTGLGNQTGLLIAGSAQIGTAGHGNTIDGNVTGIDVTGSATVQKNSFDANTTQAMLFETGAGGNLVGGSNDEGNEVRGDADGIHILPQGTPTEVRISHNAIFNLTGGIDDTDGPPAPVITSALDPGDGTTVVHGTLQGVPGTDYQVELFADDACGPTSGPGEISLDVVDVSTNGQGEATFDDVVQSTASNLSATATNTDAEATSAFSNCVQVSGAPAVGSLAGSYAQNEPGNVDLTSAGTEDWAVWGVDSTGAQSSAALVPSTRKNVSTAAISDLSLVNAGGAAAQGFGQDPAGRAFTFGWSDGTSPASATGVDAGLRTPGNGAGFSFTVPADTSTRTLTVWTTVHWAEEQLTASLSDGSAPDVTEDVVGNSYDYPELSQNAPAIITITYAAASAGQHLTVTFEQTANNCDPYGCDNAVLYAAALSGPAPSTGPTGATATLTSDSSVGMSGSDDRIADIPLDAFAPASSSSSSTSSDAAPINGLPINGLPINGLPINGLPINGLPINGLPINGLPINGLPINGLPINGLPINGLLIPGGWATVLAGTTLAGQPLQTITLQDVLSLPNPPQAVKNLTLGDLDLSGSALGDETIGALALGSTPINGLGTEATTIENDLVSWCQSAVPAADASASCTPESLGAASLFSLGLVGAPINGLPINGLPINGLPINGLPINGLPINGLDLSASPINGLPINGLPINGLPLGTLPINALPTPDDVVDCSAIDCTTATLGEASVAGAIKPDATLGDLHYYGALTIGDLEQSLAGTDVTLGDLIGLLVKRSDVPWETLSPRLLSAFDPSRPTLPVHAAFELQGTGTTSTATLALDVPEGFDPAPGTATITEGAGTAVALPDPTVSGDTLTWALPSIDLGTTYQVDLDLRSGTAVGPQHVTETISDGTVIQSSIATFSVADSFPGNGTVAGAHEITPDTSVEMSALPTSGAIDWYEIPMPPAGTRLSVHLTDLPADYDLALYSPRTTTVRTGATTGVPLQDGTVPDNGATGTQLTPTALQDVPDPGIPLVEDSSNRGTDDEDVGFLSPGGGGYVTIAVYGYNGAFSPIPYTLRVTTQASEPVSCPARSFSYTGTAGTMPTVPDGANTLILVNEQRIGATYGPDAESSVADSLNRLAADNGDGVNGVVMPVESIPGVDYTAWDANPCDVDAANSVANAIANEVAQVKDAHPSLKYVVFAGGDDEIPFFRIPDLTRIANESGFASGFGQNEYYGSLANGDLLTDDPYLDTRPVPASGRQLFVPDLDGGRLVETPSDITGAVQAFITNHGTLDASSAFVSGYDFVSDGASLVQQRLEAALPTGSAVGSLISDTWTKDDLLSAALPASGAADINSWDGHYDEYQAEPADGTGDLISTADVQGKLSGGIFFTMGCHAGFQVSNVIVGPDAPDAQDWAQTFAESDTGFVGNTGYGLGNTDSVAFSEELMADFAGELDGTKTIGQALVAAKQQYFLSRVAYSSYDEKTLSEAELYGLPMYGVGERPAAVENDTLHAATAANVPGTTSSTSPSDTTLDTFQGSTQAAPFTADPDFSGPVTDATGEYYTNAGQVQAPNYRPLQPYVTLPASRPGLTAHGVVIDGLTSTDVQNFDPDNVLPTVDPSASATEPQYDDEAWPEKVPTLVSLQGADSLDQSLDLATGQYFTDDTTSTGVERLWTHIAGRVTYSASTDFTPPTIDSMNAYTTGNGTVSFTGHFSDLTETGAPGTVVFAQVVYDVDDAGHWSPVQLVYDPSSQTWSGGAAYTGSHVQYFVEACDAAGNCGYSSNKGRYFDATALPQQAGSITVTPSGTTSSAPWFSGPVALAATSSTGAVVTVSVDGGPFESPADATITGDGSHTIDARASDGATATTVVLIDSTPPTVSLSLPSKVLAGTNVPVTPTCLDSGSGIATCTASSLDTSMPGTQQVTVTATDLAGNSTSQTFSIDVVTGPSPPGQPAADKPVNNGAFTLSWAPSTETGSAITYEIDSATTSSGPWTAVATGVTATSALVGTLPQGAYVFRVVASDGTFTATSPVSSQVVIDTTPPTVQLSGCPAIVDQGTAQTIGYTAADTGGSELATPASGTITLDTSVPGLHSVTATATDNAGNLSAAATCYYTVNAPPTAPGAPSASASPSKGAITVSWAAATDPNNDTLTYRLLHRSSAAASTYTQVASGITSTSYTFAAGSPEAEGTWTYEVIAYDGRLSGPASPASAAVVVDRTAPNAPTVTATTSPVSGAWFKDSVTVKTTANGDPSLADGSPGSGVDPSKTTGTQVLTTNGVDPVTGSVSDYAGNAATKTVSFDVDAKAPTLTLTCPTGGVPAGSTASATWTASDGESGLSGVSSGSVALTTTHVGSYTSSSVTVTDKVGHTTIKSCGYTVVKATPVITWAAPAPITFGTKLTATQLNATASVPGTFVYTPAAGTTPQPGTQTLSVAFTPTDTTDYNSATKSASLSVIFTTPCLTGTTSKPITVAAGTATCVAVGAVVNGAITVKSGGSLWIGGTVHGSIGTLGARAVTMCGATLTGALGIAGTTGPVTIGAAGCAPNSIVGAVGIAGNTGGVSFVGNTVHGAVGITGNTGGFAYSGNSVTGPVAVFNNS